jgi:hypothetical protein
MTVGPDGWMMDARTDVISSIYRKGPERFSPVKDTPTNYRPVIRPNKGAGPGPADNLIPLFLPLHNFFNI